MVEGLEVEVVIGGVEVVDPKQLKDRAGIMISQVGVKLLIVHFCTNHSKIRASKPHKPLFNQVNNLICLISSHNKATKVVLLIRFVSLEQVVSFKHKASARDNILIKFNNNLTQTLQHQKENLQRELQTKFAITLPRAIAIQ